MANIHIFKPFWHKHLAEKPIWITSKKQLKEECAKRGKISPYAEGASLNFDGKNHHFQGFKDRPRKVFSFGGKK